MFNVNDTILYGTHGICKVTDITEQRFNDKSNKYYILQPHHNPSSTIYVPTDNEKLVSRMRHTLSEEEIYELLKSMPDTEGSSTLRSSRNILTAATGMTASYPPRILTRIR